MSKTIITIYPYREVGWKGWAVTIEDPITKELWQRCFHYKKDAERTKKDLEGMSLEYILDTYGADYFEQVR